MLNELCDQNFVLLQPALHELGAVDVDGIQDVGGVVFHKGAAVNQQQPLCPALQQSHQLLGHDELGPDHLIGHDNNEASFPTSLSNLLRWCNGCVLKGLATPLC